MWFHHFVRYFVRILELNIELRINMKWNDDLEDKTSEAFKKLSGVFENEVRITYTRVIAYSKALLWEIFLIRI